jgi:hypothetical protein
MRKGPALAYCHFEMSQPTALKLIPQIISSLKAVKVKKPDFALLKGYQNAGG